MPNPFSEREFTDIINGYANEVENMRKRQTHNGIFTPLSTGNGITPKLIDDFNRMIGMYGNQLASILPHMNFDQWSQFSELVSSHVALMAMSRNGK